MREFLGSWKEIDLSKRSATLSVSRLCTQCDCGLAHRQLWLLGHDRDPPKPLGKINPPLSRFPQMFVTAMAVITNISPLTKVLLQGNGISRNIVSKDLMLWYVIMIVLICYCCKSFHHT